PVALLLRLAELDGHPLVQRDAGEAQADLRPAVAGQVRKPGPRPAFENARRLPDGAIDVHRMLDVHRCEYPVGWAAAHVPRGPCRQGHRARADRGLLVPFEAPRDRADGVEVRVVHALLERDDRVVGDVDVLRAHLLAALRDVAVADSGGALQEWAAVEDVLRVHLEARDAHHEARPVVLLLQVVVAQDVADVLAEEALDALAKLEHAVDVLLLYAPRLARGHVLLVRGERRDLLVHLVVPADVGDQVLDQRESLHRADGDRAPVLGDGRLAHQARVTVDLGRAG